MLTTDSISQAWVDAEMELARRVQLRLLPKCPPVLPGLEIAAESCPAQQVGGDFFDFIYRPGRPFIFTVGDMAGKGLSAALLMSMTRTVMRSAAKFTTICTPKAIMDRSNADLYDDFTEVGTFATAFIGQFQIGREVLSFANAGHSPVIYRPFDGPARLIEADGTAMGILPVSSWASQVLPFRPGDVLIVATDGFSEAQAENGDLYGYERLLNLADAVAEEPAARILEAFFDTVRVFESGQPQSDDQTMVVLRRVPA